MRLQFGDFIVDEGTRQLLRDGAAVHLSPKAFDLLLDADPRASPRTHEGRPAQAALAEDIRLRREPGHGRRRSARGAWRKRASAALRPHRPSSWLRISGECARTAGTVRPAPMSHPMTRHPPSGSSRPRARFHSSRATTSSAAIRRLACGSIRRASRRRHAVIRVKDDGAILEDLGSKNGTHAGDTRVTTAIHLADGDQLRFGSVGCQLQSLGRRSDAHRKRHAVMARCR